MVPVGIDAVHSVRVELESLDEVEQNFSHERLVVAADYQIRARSRLEVVDLAEREDEEGREDRLRGQVHSVPLEKQGRKYHQKDSLKKSSLGLTLFRYGLRG